MKKNYNSDSLEYHDYSNEAKEDLKKILEADGFEYQEGGFGGVGGEPIQIIAHININSDGVIWTLALGVLSNLIYDLLKSLMGWWKAHGKKSKEKPVIFIHIYRKKESLHPLTFRIDAVHSKREIREQIKENLRLVRRLRKLK